MARIHQIDEEIPLEGQVTLAHALRIYDEVICKTRGAYHHYLMAQSTAAGLQLESHRRGAYVIAPVMTNSVTLRHGGTLEREGEYQTDNTPRRDVWELLYSRNKVRERAAALPLDTMLTWRKTRFGPLSEYQDMQLKTRFAKGICSMEAWGTSKALDKLARGLARILPYERH